MNRVLCSQFRKSYNFSSVQSRVSFSSLAQPRVPINVFGVVVASHLNGKLLPKMAASCAAISRRERLN